MNPQSLVADLLDLALCYGDDFEAAVKNTRKAIEDVIADRVTASTLKYDLGGWNSYHCQSEVAQGKAADLRLAYRRTNAGIEVASFGNRREPSGFYDNLKSRLSNG